MRRLQALTAAITVTLVTLLAPAGSASTAPLAAPTAAKKCPITLATDLGWDTSDPGFIRVAPRVTWKNCKNRIERVLVTTRVLKSDGSPLAEKTMAYFPNRTGSGQGQAAFYIYSYVGVSLIEAPATPSNMTAFMLTSCAPEAQAKLRDIPSAYYYTSAQALDAKGKVIKQAFGPKHLCGQ